MVKKQKKPHGGVDVSHNKNSSACVTERFSNPVSVRIPMKMHIGAACECIVAAGDRVLRGQVIGDNKAFVSAPVHSSVSGVVSEVSEITLPSGIRQLGVTIISDNQMKLADGIEKPYIGSLQDFLSAIKQSGLTGLGGAGFPTHAKLTIPEGVKIGTLLINASECEPYITSDHREMLEYPDDIIEGIDHVCYFLGIKRVIIGIEDNKPDAIDLLHKKLAGRGNFTIMELKSFYPYGAEKVLIYSCTGKKVPIGALPSHIGCLVLNVSTVSFIGKLMKKGMPLIERRVTLDGGAVGKPANMLAPIGTGALELFTAAGGFTEKPGKVLMGGLMMGMCFDDENTPVMKQTNAFLALNQKQSRLAEPGDCINCGRCLDNCPMSLPPTLIHRAVDRRDIEELKKLNVASCVECGCCAYCCPAHRHITQTIKLGKALLRENK